MPNWALVLCPNAGRASISLPRTVTVGQAGAAEASIWLMRLAEGPWISTSSLMAGP